MKHLTYEKKNQHSFLNIQLISGLLSNLVETSDDTSTPPIFLGQPPTTQTLTLLDLQWRKYGILEQWHYKFWSTLDSEKLISIHKP